MDLKGFVFPSDDDGPLDPSWWAPLEAVARVIRDDARYRFFELRDFMVMARRLRRGRPSILLYKHGYTRHYLNLDDAGHAYRWIAPRSRSTNFGGRYVLHRDLPTALDALELWELPWMKPNLESERRGLSWDERWELFDVLTGAA